MKIQKFILPIIAMMMTSVFGEPVVEAPATVASAPSQATPARPSSTVPPGANNPNSTPTPTQPASPATGPQTFVTNNLSGQTFVTNKVSGQTFVTNTLTGQNTNQQF
jgi:hypothetical protein